MLPLVGAIAAGCTCIVKPSEFNPACAALLADLFPKYLDPAAYRIINGAATETTALLELRWDHIFFTGSGRVGRIVAAAAAKNVTPITLELGSKSPVFIDANNTDIELAAKRILWGKQQNAGQVFISLHRFPWQCSNQSPPDLCGAGLYLGSAGTPRRGSPGVPEGV
jgi:aldehyde dehydrogenase (NAD+)